MSRARAAAAGYRFLASQNHGVRIRVADVPKGTVVVHAHPDDQEVVESLYSPAVLDAVFDKTSRGLVLSSAFTTVFEGLTIAGLAAGKGPAAATSELLDRVLPDTAETTVALATQLSDLVRSNSEKINRLGRSSAPPYSPRSSAAPARPRSSATQGNGDNGNGNNGNGNGDNGNGNNGNGNGDNGNGNNGNGFNIDNSNGFNIDIDFWRI